MDLQESIKTLKFNPILLESITFEQLKTQFEIAFRENNSFLFNEFKNGDTYFMQVLELKFYEFADYLLDNYKFFKDTISATNNENKNTLMITLELTSTANPEEKNFLSNIIKNIVNHTINLTDDNNKTIYDYLKLYEFRNKEQLVKKIQDNFNSDDGLQHIFFSESEIDSPQLEPVTLELISSKSPPKPALTLPRTYDRSYIENVDRAKSSLSLPDSSLPKSFENNGYNDGYSVNRLGTISLQSYDEDIKETRVGGKIIYKLF
ncbi:MAG: hypothetical protein CMF62_03060 [Magnetococcales bacterium]|nr:hypothetical protein [Magnetococcales bacterium]|tara:strand:- start:23703 stop:24491 length:789 start_codon:yes stop_codon:yes gene_type:complete